MSLVSLSTAFIMAWFEGNFLSPKKKKKENGVKHQDVTGEKSDHLQKLNSLTSEDTGDPAGLYLGLGHDGSKGVDKTHNRRCGMLQVGGKYMLVEAHTVAALVHDVAWQVWEIIVVASGK